MKPVLAATGPDAPPMANGEFVFEMPWQGRIFGMATSLAAQGVFAWDDFRQRLIDRIAAWEVNAPEGMPYQYYDRFLEALEDVLVERDLLRSGELRDRVQAYAARPHGHDH
jgi:nitrile hydratase accessory protein